MTITEEKYSKRYTKQQPNSRSRAKKDIPESRTSRRLPYKDSVVSRTSDVYGEGGRSAWWVEKAKDAQQAT
jgi:hypothetical protein